LRDAAQADLATHEAEIARLERVERDESDREEARAKLEAITHPDHLKALSEPELEWLKEVDRDGFNAMAARLGRHAPAAAIAAQFQHQLENPDENSPLIGHVASLEPIADEAVGVHITAAGTHGVLSESVLERLSERQIRILKATQSDLWTRSLDALTPTRGVAQ
jgi:hypothetical protein